MKPLLLLIGLIVVAAFIIFASWNFYFLDKIITLAPLSHITKGDELPYQGIIFKEFRDTSGLKIKYPASFANFEIENVEKLITKEIIEKRNFKYVFGVVDPDGRARLTVSEMEFEPQLTPEQVIEEIRQDNQLLGAKVNVLNTQADGNSVIYDAGYERKGLSLKAKVKLIFVKDSGQPRMKVYDVGVLALSSEYNNLLPIINRIIQGTGF